MMIAIVAIINSIAGQNRSGDELYSQIAAGYSTWDYVYSFEYTGYAAADTYGADDFEVPVGETWEIFSVKSIMLFSVNFKCNLF